MNQTEFIFQTFDEAISVHKKLFEIMRNNGVVTYADLHIAANKEYNKKDIEYFNYGWTNLWYSKVEPYDDDGNWILRMPKMEHFKYI